jgi:hypothetical protein
MARQYATMQTPGPVPGQQECYSAGICMAFGVLKDENSRLRAELKARDERDTSALTCRKKKNLALQTENDRLHKTIKNQKNEIKRLLEKVADKEEKINKLQVDIQTNMAWARGTVKFTLDQNGSKIRELSQEIHRLKLEGARLDGQLKTMRALDSQQFKDAIIKTQRIRDLMAQVDGKDMENHQLRLTIRAIQASVDKPAEQPAPRREPEAKPGSNQLLISHLEILEVRDRYIKHLEEANKRLMEAFKTQARDLDLVWQAVTNRSQLLKPGHIQTFAQSKTEMASPRVIVQLPPQNTKTATDKLAEHKTMGREVQDEKTDQNRDDTDKSSDVQDKATETQDKNMEVPARVPEIQDVSAWPQLVPRQEFMGRPKPLQPAGFTYGNNRQGSSQIPTFGTTAPVPEEQKFNFWDVNADCIMCTLLPNHDPAKIECPNRRVALGSDLSSEGPTAKAKTDDEVDEFWKDLVKVDRPWSN